MRTALPYVPYGQLAGRPNIVVDGSPTEGTVLTLSHWPKMACPSGLERDLSAQMAFAALSWTDLAPDAEAVSNNHFDQDGLVSVFALAQPEEALRRRERLEDLAAAGDFATFRWRDSARASVVVASFADQEEPYDEALGRLVEILEHPDRYRDRWEAEDAVLEASEDVIGRGAVSIEERPDLDLAVVRVDEAHVHLPGGGRFTHIQRSGLHPMAVCNATRCFAVATLAGDDYRFEYRYESWVQYRSRRLRARRDLTELASHLNEVDPAGGWAFEGVASLTPQLARTAGPGAPFGPQEFLDHLCRHLTTAPPAWDPYPADPGQL